MPDWLQFSRPDKEHIVIEGQPVACFQPFIDTATGRIAGVEALGRLRHADGSLRSVGPLFTDPRISPSALRRLDRDLLRDALRVVKAFQQHLRLAFHLGD